MNNKVHLAPCGDYELDGLIEAVRRCFDAFGGVEACIGHDKRVAVKPNLVSKHKPGDAVCTHPALLEAVTAVLRDYGNTVIVAESPGGLYNPAALRSNYRFNGMEQAAERCGAILNYDCSTVRVDLPEGKACRGLDLLRPIMEADAVISLARMKTHAMCYLSAAVKNLFGCVAGVEKFELHARYPDMKVFAEMLLDVAMMVKPSFSLVDAIVGMEGNGPSGGTPRKVGALIGGVSPYAVDLVCSDIMGYAPGDVPTIANAAARGLCTSRIEEIEISGSELSRFRTPDFRKPDSFGGRPASLLGLFKPEVLKYFEPRPVIDRRGCCGCGVCRDSCPVGAITVDNHKADIDPTKCIKCYCCQELCPTNKVRIKRPFFLGGRRK